MRSFLAILGAAALFVHPASARQDESRIAELIRQLDADDFQTRDRAQGQLAELGEKALPALRKTAATAGGELKIRAESTIRGIERQLKSRTVYREPRRITLDAKDQDLADVLRAIARQAGVRIEHTAIDATGKVTMKAENGPLFRVLDRLCAGARKRSYEYAEEGRIEFSRDPHVPYPTVYPGPVRVRIRKTELIRTNDFRTRKAVLQLSLDADYEKYLKPLAGAQIEIKTARDDRGTKLEISEGFDSAGNGMLVRGGRIIIGGRVFGGTQPDTLHKFSLKGIDGKAARFTIVGNVLLSFPLSSRSVRIEAPQTTKTVDVDGYQITIQRRSSRRPFRFTFKAPPGSGMTEFKDIHGRLDPDSLTAVDGNGKEFKGTFDTGNARVTTFVVGRGFGASTDPGVTLETRFAGVSTTDIKEIRFKFVDQTFLKRIPFEFPNLELP